MPLEASTQAASPAPADPIVALIERGELREAIGRCAETHGRAIGRVCMAMLANQAEAEEVTQETLLTAYAALASFRGDGSLRAWLFGIARHLCAHRLETRARQARRLVLVHDAERAGEVPDDLLEARRRAHRVRAALAELKPSERDALVLHYEGGLSFREVAVACGIDEAAARKRASRALARLRELLNDEAAR